MKRRGSLVLPVLAAALLAPLATGSSAAAGLLRPALAHPAKPWLTPVAVFGIDDRQPLPQSHRALAGKIGVLVDSRSRSVCTAFCVGEAIVATAGHCLYRTEGESLPRLGDFRFMLDPRSGRESARIAGAATGAGAQHILSGSLHLRVRPPIDATHDWAFVKLTRRACLGGVLPLGTHSTEAVLALAAARRVYQVSYHRDYRNWELAYGGPCPMRRDYGNADWTSIARDFDDADNLLLHNCDTGGASSGSPLLVDGPGGPEVVGINVGTYVQSKVIMHNGEVIHRFKSDTVANTGVNTSPLKARLEAFAAADIIGDRGGIEQLQQRLAERRFYMGPNDGRYGPRLRAAIEAFERAAGLIPMGLATHALLRRLMTLEMSSALPPAHRAK